MNQTEAYRILNMAKAHFESNLEWSKDDTDAGMIFMTSTLLALIDVEMPVTSKKYPDVLRALANVLDLVIDKAIADAKKDKD